MKLFRPMRNLRLAILIVLVIGVIGGSALIATTQQFVNCTNLPLGHCEGDPAPAAPTPAFDNVTNDSDWIEGSNNDDWIFGDIPDTTTPYVRGADWPTGAGAGDWSADPAGDDRVSGNNGDDIQFGGPGHDTLIGGIGADWLCGGPGNDFLYGGPGHDEYYWTWAAGLPVFDGFQAPNCEDTTGLDTFLFQAGDIQDSDEDISSACNSHDVAVFIGFRGTEMQTGSTSWYVKDPITDKRVKIPSSSTDCEIRGVFDKRT